MHALLGETFRGEPTKQVAATGPRSASLGFKAGLRGGTPGLQIRRRGR